MASTRVVTHHAPRSRPGRGLVMGILVTAGFAAVGWVSTSRLILPGVVVEGIPVGGLTLAEARRTLASRLSARLDQPCSVNAGLEEVDVRPAEVGLGVDLSATLTAAYAPGHRGSLDRRVREWLGAGRARIPVPATVRWDDRAFRRWTDSLNSRYGRKPVEAGWRALPGGSVEVTAAAVGRQVPAEELRSRLRRAAFAAPPGRSFPLPLSTVHPRRTTDQAVALGIREVVSRYRTHFDPRDANRTGNLRLAAAAIGQVVLQPGETFSFNKAVGPRIPDSGYREAPVVVNGRLVPGVGGGVCQVSSTLYNAVLLGDLRVLVRHRHSIPSAYVPPGRDATVAYDYFDLRFRNSRDWPVVLDLELGPGWLEARVLGRKEPGERVEVRTEILETYPPPQEKVPDPALPVGQAVVAAKGSPGYRVKVWQIVYRDGTEVARRLVSHDRYQPLSALVRVGTRPR